METIKVIATKVYESKIVRGALKTLGIAIAGVVAVHFGLPEGTLEGLLG